MAIYVYTGLPGSGKTLRMAQASLNILRRNMKYYKKTGIKRMLVSNIKYSPLIEQEYGELITYWTDLEQLIKQRDCDVIFDEIATYLDSTQWANLSLNVKRWLQLHRHYGIDIYGTTQDFLMIDKAMRRLVKQAYICRKVIGSRDKSATLPAVRNPWGAILIWTVKEDGKEKDREAQKTVGFPTILFISQQLTSVYDTTQELETGAFPPLKHTERMCNDCGHIKIIHN